MRVHRYILVHILWLLPLAFWPGNNSYDAAKFTVLALAVSLWLGNAAWMEWRGQSGLPLGKRGMAALGGLIFLVGAGVFNSANPTLVVRTCLLISFFGMVTLHTSLQTGDLKRQKPLLAAVTLAATAAGIYGLLQMGHWLPGAAPSSGYPPGISTLGNQNYLAGFMAVAFWPALVLFRLTPERKNRLLVITALVIILSTLAIAGATGPQVAVLTATTLVGPCIFLVKKGLGKWVPGTLLGLLVLMGCSGLGLMLNATTASSGPAHQLLAANHGHIRQADWASAWQMLKPNPVLGVGAGNYLVRWPAARSNIPSPGIGPEGAPVSTRAHNDLFQWAAETGFLGTFYLLILLVIFGMVWRKQFQAKSPEHQVHFLLLTAGLLTVAVHSMVSFPFHLPVTSGVFAFLLGLHFLSDQTPPLDTPTPMGKIQALVLIMAAIILAVGSLQEFRGDLNTASGRHHFTQGRMDDAVISFEGGLKQMKWPGYGRLYFGLTQTALGQMEDAEHNFRGSLLDRPSFEAHLALAESALNRGDYSTAHDHLDIVQNCQPHPGFIRQAKFLQAFMLVRQNQPLKAHLKFRQLLEEEPNQHRALLALGYLETQQGNPEQAEDYYKQAMKIIDGQIARFHKNPGQESAAFLVRLKQNREVAAKALNALAHTP